MPLRRVFGSALALEKDEIVAGLEEVVVLPQERIDLRKVSGAKGDGATRLDRVIAGGGPGGFILKEPVHDPSVGVTAR